MKEITQMDKLITMAVDYVDLWLLDEANIERLYEVEPEPMPPTDSTAYAGLRDCVCPACDGQTLPILIALESESQVWDFCEACLRAWLSRTVTFGAQALAA
jgi:hypothetical protein